MKPLVYIAGPYTNPDPVLNTRSAIQIGMSIYETGLAAVEIPHVSLLTHMVEPRELDFWYQYDLDKLEHCHAVYRFAGVSSGADKEEEFAESLELPIFYEKNSEMADLLMWCRGWKP